MPVIRIQTLGLFRVWRQGGLIPKEAWPTQRSQEIFKILLTERGHFVPAERLMEYLWPHLPPKRAQNNLWVAVSQARRVLQPDLPRRSQGAFVLTGREGYTFPMDSDHWLDAAEFGTLYQKGRQAEQMADKIRAFEAARQLYCGDYLEEDPYAEWVLAEREALRRDYLALLAELAETYARRGSYRRATSLCYESLATDNTDEAIYRKLMTYHYGAGDQKAALKAFEECRQALEAELDVEPMPETLDLYRQIQVHQVEAVDRTPVYPAPVQMPVLPLTLDRTPFVGRQQEHGQLSLLLPSALAGQGRVALMEGEPGIGKSRLVHEVAGQARALGLGTLIGQCYQFEQSVPYQPIVDLVRQVVADWPAETLERVPSVWLSEITTLLPELPDRLPGLAAQPADVDEARQGRLFQALVRLLVDTTGRDGLLLVVDDIHWADPVTLQFLHHLARNLADQPIVLICTYRGEAFATEPDLSSFIHNVQREAHALQIRLGALTEGDVGDLLQHTAGTSTLPSDLGPWLHRETDGNPFFLVSILQSLFEQGFLTTGEDGGWQVDRQSFRAAASELALPEALRESVRERLRRIPRTMRQLLELASVLGQRFAFATLQAVAQQAPEAILDGIEALVERRLLQEDESAGFYAFSHDKIREVVYDDLSNTRQRLLHRNVATILEGQHGAQPGGQASVLAFHFERAGESARAMHYWLLAGEHALGTYASQQALRHYERALALAGAAEEKARAYYGLGRSHFGLEDLDAAVADLEQGLRLTSTEDARPARMLYLLADVHFARYDSEACEAYAQRALAAAEAAGDQETLAQSLSLLGQVYSTRGELDAEFELIDRALAISRRSENTWREGRTLADRAWLLAQIGDFSSAVSSAEAALERLRSTEDQAGVAFAWNTLGRARGGAGDYGAAFDAFERSNEIADAIGHRFLAAQVPNMLGWLRYQLCDYEGALASDREGVELAVGWGKSPPEISARINVALDVLQLGQPARALSDLEAIQIQIEREISGFHAWRWRLRVLQAKGLCHLALEEPGPALELASAGAALASSTSSRKYVALNHELRGTALALKGEITQASAELVRAIELADALPYQPLRWGARRRLALLYEDAGRGAEAGVLLGEARNVVEQIAAGLAREPLRAAFLSAEPIRAFISA